MMVAPREQVRSRRAPAERHEGQRTEFAVNRENKDNIQATGVIQLEGHLIMDTTAATMF